MTLDFSTGLELELVLPEGMSRLALLDALATRFGGTVRPLIFPSKVPVPVLPFQGGSAEEAAAATLALIEDIARHHQAKVQSVSPDFRFFYLAHRAGALISSSGEQLLAVVHDNTLAGGERVAELVTKPLRRHELDWLEDLVGTIALIEGCTLPDTAALHVHVDGRPFLATRPLAQLARIYRDFEGALRALLRTPPALKRAAALPLPLVGALIALAEGERPFAEAREVLRAHVLSRGFGLNLFNLIDPDPAKLTVELKLAAATLDPRRVIATRELFVHLSARALDPPLEACPRTDGAALLEWLDLPRAHRAALLAG
ncbi:MAG: amidoligase family protein [Deltaproteobacteria bacterium]|nr:amidoligase family protein [Deltaproteobacteria bacterium]